MDNKNVEELTKCGYDKPESAHALIKLILSTNINNETKIALNMVLSDIKSTIEIILEIQNNIL